MDARGAPAVPDQCGHGRGGVELPLDADSRVVAEAAGFTVKNTVV